MKISLWLLALLGAFGIAAYLYAMSEYSKVIYNQWTYRHTNERNIILVQTIPCLTRVNEWHVFAETKDQRVYLFGPANRDSANRISRIFWTKDRAILCISSGDQIRVAFDFEARALIRDTESAAKVVKRHPGPGIEIYPDFPEGEGRPVITEISTTEANSWLRLVPKSPKE